MTCVLIQFALNLLLSWGKKQTLNTSSLDLRTGSRGMRSSAAYPAGFAKHLANEHQKFMAGVSTCRLEHCKLPDHLLLPAWCYGVPTAYQTWPRTMGSKVKCSQFPPLHLWRLIGFDLALLGSSKWIHCGFDTEQNDLHSHHLNLSQLVGCYIKVTLRMNHLCAAKCMAGPVMAGWFLDTAFV